MKSTSTFRQFRNIAIAEGASFLLLLFIAMPLKYFANLPIAVRIAGSIHGILFVAFIVLSWNARNEYKKPLGWWVKAFVSSILPFGTFVMDKQWKKEELAIS